MAFKVDIAIKESFEVTCTPERAFALLADVPESISHFPKIEQLVDLGDNKYRTEMEKIGLDRYNIQTIYACKYTPDPEKLSVKWTPVKGEGNGVVSGKWTIKPLKNGEGAKINFETKGEMELPLPGLVKMVVAPIVRHEFQGMVDTYLENLQTTLDAPPKKKPAKKAAKKKTAAKKTTAKKK